jgi:hypothetical protein
MNMHDWGQGAWFLNGVTSVPWIVGFVGPLALLFLLWSFIWKGLALWHSARRAEPLWFVIFLVVNTLGILEIIYLFFVAKLKFDELFSKHEHHNH